MLASRRLSLLLSLSLAACAGAASDPPPASAPAPAPEPEPAPSEVTEPDPEPAAYDPCEGKSCGDSCTICSPDDADCMETMEVKTCDAAGTCSSAPAACDA